MKSLLISIKPRYLMDILNGEKTLEIRKSKPKCDLPIDVYIYCTKDKKHKLEYCDYNGGCWCANDGGDYFNGKVVAKFTVRKVEEIELNRNHFVNEEYSTDELCGEELLEQSCLTYRELDDYLQCEIGYAYHIEDLVIFDKPKELSEFRKPSTLSLKQLREFGLPYDEKTYKEMATKGKWFITKAPQSYCFIESEK